MADHSVNNVSECDAVSDTTRPTLRKIPRRNGFGNQGAKIARLHGKSIDLIGAQGDVVTDNPEKTHNEPEKTAPTETLPEKPTRPTTIEEIALLLKPPLTPLRDKCGLLYDKVSLGAKCSIGHIHKYYLSDIINSDGYLSCQTCSHGCRSVALAREIVESLLEIPFTYKQKTQNKVFEYSNPHMGITLLMPCIDNTSSREEDIYTLRIKSVKSPRIIKQLLHDALLHHPGLTIRMKRNLGIAVPRPARKIIRYQHGQLPVRPELAFLSIKNAENPMLAQMQMNIVDSAQLLLENC